MMRRTCLVLALALGTSSCAQSQAAGRTLTPAEWKQDLVALARELPKRHANAFHHVSREGFDTAAAQLQRRLDSVNSDAAIVGLASIVATVGDVHTRLRLPATWRRLAIVPTWFGCLQGSQQPCELRVTAAAPGFERAIGARIVEIGGVPVDDVQRRLTAMIPQHESEGAVWWMSATYLQFPNLLRGIGVAGDTSAVSITLADSADASFTMNIATVARNAATHTWTAVGPVSLRLADPARPLSWTLLRDSQTVLLSFDGYPDKGDFRRATEELLAFMNAHRATRLAIDLRRNPGGDFTKGREILIPALKKHAALGTKGNLYVLVGPGTHSAAMTNSVDLRNDLGAILVGLPTGSRPNGYQEGREFTLPKSGLSVGYSTKLYKFQSEDTPGVMPDHRVETSWADIRGGRDAVMEWLLAQPRVAK
jgi:hypothetical protein